ncbi:MAG: hypothetical protein LBD04_02815 [Synergistaceae bacterium]|jgi:hypothetical protein|nr:hypothetical protein [Synergistaceae bacterium]
MAKNGFKSAVDFGLITEAREKASTLALWRQGQAVVSQVQRDRLAPIETGALRRSAVVTLNHLPNPEAVYAEAREKAVDNPALPPAGARAAKAYVSYNTPYAEALHERLDWKPRATRKLASGRVVQKPAEGGPKWLEKALAACKSKFPAIVSRTFKEVFK